MRNRAFENEHLKIQSSPKCKARENFAAPHMVYMQARNFLRNAAVGMKSEFYVSIL
jgi:hypothetical protein